MSDWAGVRVLVTGPTGFIGRRLLALLADAGAEIWAGVYPGDPPAARAAPLPTAVQRCALDVTQAASVTQAVAQARPDVLFHLAAAGVSEPGIAADRALTINTLGTIRVLEAARAHAVARTVLVGTCHEYGGRRSVEGLDPYNFYAASKAAAWAFVRAYWWRHELDAVVVRPFQVYGPGQAEGALVPAALRAARAGDDFPTTPGQQQRDFIYVDDVARGIAAAGRASGLAGASLDLGTGRGTPVLDVVHAIWRLAGAQGEIRPGALPYRRGIAMRLVADAERSAQRLGWRATVELEEGLRLTMKESL